MMLIKILLTRSYGNFDSVSDPSEITNKVVNLLSSSLLPVLTNVSIHTSCNDDNLLSIAPNPLIFEGNLMNIYIKRSYKTNTIEDILINGNIRDEEVEIIIDKFFRLNNCLHSLQSIIMKIFIMIYNQNHLVRKIKQFLINIKNKLLH